MTCFNLRMLKGRIFLVCLLCETKGMDITMGKKIISMMLLITLLFTFSFVAAEEEQDLEGDEIIEGEVTEEEQEKVKTLTLEESMELALKNNLEKIVLEKQMALQDIQLEISDDANRDLRKLARDMSRMADSLSSQLLGVQKEISYVENLDFSMPTTDGAIEVLAVHYDELKTMPFSNQVLSGLEKYAVEHNFPGGADAAKMFPPEKLIEGLTEVKDQVGKGFFEISTGENQTVKQVNQMAASILGLQATRRLTTTQAANLIQTKTRQAAKLLVYSDTDVSEGFKLLAESSFYGLLQAKKMFDVQSRVFTRSQKQYDDSLLTFEQGMMSKSDLQLVKMQLNGSTISKKGAEIDYQKAMMDFNRAVGLPFDTEVELVEEEHEEIELDLEKALEIAYDYRTDMFTARQELELAEKNLEYVDDRHRKDRIEYEESLAYYQHQEVSLENVWLKAQDSVRKALLDYQQADFSYEIAKENLEIMKDQLAIAELAHEIGYSVTGGSPLIALLEVQEQYASVEQGIASAEFGRNLAMQNYLKEVGYAHFLKNNK